MSIKSVIKFSSFPSPLKLADVTSVHKKGRKDMKGNFRSVIILPTLSKIFEKCMFAQMCTFFNNIFSNQQCGFPKGYSTQSCLLIILETWNRSSDKGKIFGALVTDLSKRSDCLDHELRTSKLNEDDFSLPALRLINDYS